MDHGLRALGLSLLLLTISGCGADHASLAPSIASQSFDPETMLDARASCAPTCAVHGLVCTPDLVPVTSGLPVPPVLRNKHDEARRRANPSAWRGYATGSCVGSREEQALVLYCSECRAAYSG